MKIRERKNLDIYKENGLKVPYCSNIVEEVSTKNQIRATLEVVAKTLIGTLGPYGSTTILQDREGKNLITKDGYDIMNRIAFDSEVARTVVQLIRSISSNQVLTVGDGSTSSIVVAAALYNVLTDPEQIEHFKRVAAKDIVDILNDIAEFVEEKLKETAIPVDDNFSQLDKIATVATNNDNETGKFVADLYRKIGRYGFVSTEVLGKQEKDTAEIKNGIEWSRGYQDSVYGKEYENGKVIYENNPRVLLFNYELTYSDIEIILMQLIQKSLNQEGAELLIVANGYDDDVLNFLRANRTKHLQMAPGQRSYPMLFTPVDIDNITEKSIHDMEDLAIILGCEIFDKYKIQPAEVVANPERFIGHAEKIIVTKKTTQIIAKEGVCQQDIMEKHLAGLNEKLKKLLEIEEPTKDEDFDLYEVRRRISHLTNSTAVIKVGGKTLQERMSRERLIEDAIFACKSTLEYGYIPGGNLCIPLILRENQLQLAEKLSEKYSYLPIESRASFFGYFIEMLEDAFLESYRNVLNNSYFSEEDSENVIEKCLSERMFYNLKTHQYEKMEETNVINSVMTDVEIMKSTISIVSLLSTSNQIVCLNLAPSENIVQENK